jgi:hypothetical protein
MKLPVYFKPDLNYDGLLEAAPWSTVLLEKIIKMGQTVKKFRACYGTRSFMCVNITAPDGSYPEPHESSQSFQSLLRSNLILVPMIKDRVEEEGGRFP